MADINFISSAFAQFPQLESLLQAQRIHVTTDSNETCHTAVYTASESGASINTAGYVAEARKLGVKRVVILRAEETAWNVAEHLGGRLLEVSLPSTKLDTSGSAIMLLSCILAAPFTSMIAADTQSSALIDLARRVAKHDVSVFINGPTGSGKEVLSRLVHEASARADNPFVALNCAAIPENMLEAMLFGHEKGAFTGASAANKGYFRAADGGTLLLDEISEMPLTLQAKLLRVLQEKVVTPVGSQKEVPVDLRVLATSNVDMDKAIAEGNFREDLFYRLNVFPLETLALCERQQDIPALAQAFLARHGQAENTPLLTSSAVQMLIEHSWPGNVRELENVMQRALVLADGDDISPEHILLQTRRAGTMSPKEADSLPKPALAAHAA